MKRQSFAFLFCIICALVCVVIWYAVYTLEAGRNLAVRFFDIGQGDGIFIELPNHVQVLIDGGPSNAILSKLGDAMPFWDRTIDLVVLTHPHADHVDGLIDVMKRYDVGMVIESGVSYATPDYNEWNRLLKEKHIPVVYARRGQRVRLSEKGILDILSPLREVAGKRFANVHDSMVVSRLAYGSKSMLFMGDGEKPIEYRLISDGESLVSDVLKIGHHGSKTSTIKEFLDAVRPSMAVISVGRKNKYGHPYEEVVDRILAASIRLFRTDTDGDVVLMSDGEHIWKSN
ncbi:MAG: MBL fold metallo-hydrolase [bacterium]|nr:MBL fold metallo-hydrolase [bacterium]MDZ4285829.1 MBL fold metallo-hydrolase [Candidatus Sungbacteria bacterium]